MLLSVVICICLFSHCTCFSWSYYSTFWVEYRSLRGCCSFWVVGIAFPLLHPSCAVPWGSAPFPVCLGWGRGRGLRVCPLHPAPGSKKLPQLGDIPGDSQLFKRGLGSVRKWAIFLTVSKSCTWKEQRTQETETGAEQATKHHSQLCIPALAEKIFSPAF